MSVTVLPPVPSAACNGAYNGQASQEAKVSRPRSPLSTSVRLMTVAQTRGRPFCPTRAAGHFVQLPSPEATTEVVLRTSMSQDRHRRSLLAQNHFGEIGRAHV